MSVNTLETGQRHKPSVVFSHAVLGQTDKGVRRVPELPLPVVVQHERLYPLEGREHRLRAPRTEGRQYDTAGDCAVH